MTKQAAWRAAASCGLALVEDRAPARDSKEMKVNKKYLIYSIIIAVVLIAIILLRIWYLHILSYGVIDNSENFSLTWTLSNVELDTVYGQRADGSAVFMLIQNESLVFVENQRFGDHLLKSLNLQNGDTLWQTNIKNNGRVLAIVNDSEQVYIGYTQSSAGSDASTRGSITVNAYDLMSGELSWSSNYEGISGISEMILTNSIIAISGSSGHGAFFGDFLIDAITGKIISSNLSEVPIIQDADPVNFLQSERITDDIYVIRTTKNRIYAINSTNNVVLWQIDEANVASNFSLSNGVVHFLTGNAELKALDAETGEIIGSIIFKPAYLSREYPLRHHVSTFNDVIVMYIGFVR
ncbi:MAG: PQQ-binding-like beta-propeller repeat protein [Anaerolineaceae bacterium]|nr:PQQ-binding-like beta-propeller repeat protein [Anaerolineaceae bacterium]